MPESRKKAAPRTYEVLVSFNGLDKGDRFAQDGDDVDWASTHVRSGYLRDVTEGVADVRGGEGQG